MAFVDGQNLYQHAKDAFGHHHPNYDLVKLHNWVCETKGWRPNAIRFYTGVPDHRESEMWAGYWSNRVLSMKRNNIVVTTRPIRYRRKTVEIAGERETVITPQEKGVDVRLALDIVSLARKRQYDVAVIYSQDQDLQEVVAEIKEISAEQNRWIKVACAFPTGPEATSTRGIEGTEWIKVCKEDYDQCLDPRDYRPARRP